MRQTNFSKMNLITNIKRCKLGYLKLKTLIDKNKLILKMLKLVKKYTC